MKSAALMTTLAAAGALVAGCFNPQFQQGVPCTEDRECPDGQICHTDDRCYDPDQIPDDAGVDPSAALSSLEVSLGELVPPFDPQTTQYTLDLGLGAAELVVTPTAVDATATIAVSGSPVDSGSPSAPVALNLGDNTVTVEVEAGNGDMATYEIAVDRGGAILQRAYVKASNTGQGDSFGLSVAVSGDTIAVSAPSEDSSATGINGNEGNDDFFNSGAVYVFVRDGTSWVQQAYIKASNTDETDFFGRSVALQDDTLVVGAPGEGSSATGINGDETDNTGQTSTFSSGAVYVFVRTGTEWTQQAYIKASNTGDQDSFGSSVDLDAETLVVGAPKEQSSATGVNGNEASDASSNSGAAYVFVRNGEAWSQQAYIKASNTGGTDNFGTHVAISGNLIACSAPFEKSSATGVNGDESDDSADFAGAVYVFSRSGTVWSQEAYLKASNTNGGGDFFGAAIAMSNDTLAVGAPFEDSSATGVGGNQADDGAPNSGAVYVFRRSATGSWAQEAYIKASNTDSNDAFGGEPSGFVGRTLAIKNDSLLVSAIDESSSATGLNGNESDNSVSGAGALYLFKRVEDTWSQQAYLKSSNPGSGDSFGYSVALSENGTIVVGAIAEDSAATGVNGNQLDNSRLQSGAIYVIE